MFSNKFSIFGQNLPNDILHNISLFCDARATARLRVTNPRIQRTIDQGINFFKTDIKLRLKQLSRTLNISAEIASETDEKIWETVNWQEISHLLQSYINSFKSALNMDETLSTVTIDDFKAMEANNYQAIRASLDHIEQQYNEEKDNIVENMQKHVANNSGYQSWHRPILLLAHSMVFNNDRHLTQAIKGNSTSWISKFARNNQGTNKLNKLIIKLATERNKVFLKEVIKSISFYDDDDDDDDDKITDDLIKLINEINESSLANKIDKMVDNLILLIQIREIFMSVDAADAEKETEDEMEIGNFDDEGVFSDINKQIAAIIKNSVSTPLDETITTVKNSIVERIMDTDRIEYTCANLILSDNSKMLLTLIKIAPKLMGEKLETFIQAIPIAITNATTDTTDESYIQILSSVADAAKKVGVTLDNTYFTHESLPLPPAMNPTNIQLSSI
jgi:hypothetical protein